MIFQPAIVALLVGSIVISFMLLYSSYYGAWILRRWDIKSGSDLQLSLERRTYLISTVMNYALGFQLFSLFLFIYTADHLNTFFAGAMCAAGTLNVNNWGYPTIALKVVNFLLAAIWLILNYTDNRAYDYPLTRKKYGILLLITPVVLIETFLQANYFLSLRPDVITSCCGTLFTSGTQGIASDIISLPHALVGIAFYSGMFLTLFSGLYFFLRGKRGYVFSTASTVTFVVSVVALISFICLYFYELPTHHCPFCILQREYGYVGYLIYVTLLGGVASGMGVGVIMPFTNIRSLSGIVPSIQRRLALTSVVLYSVFFITVAYKLGSSNLRM